MMSVRIQIFLIAGVISFLHQGVMLSHSAAFAQNEHPDDTAKSGSSASRLEVSFVNKLEISDHPWDNGDSLDVKIYTTDSFFETLQVTGDGQTQVSVQVCQEYGGIYETITSYPPNDGSWTIDSTDFSLATTISDLSLDDGYYFRIILNDQDKIRLIAETLQAAHTKRQWFVGTKGALFFVGVVICGSVILFIEMAKRGRPLKVRKIAGLEAVDEAVGRATEMGRSILYIPGIQDMNDIQTIAGLNILARVARTAADYDAEVEVPTDRSLVMTAARETLQGAYLAGGRPDAYSPDMAYYVTDEQFGYVAYVSGHMVREKPAACFYLGAFFAESLILAETGNSIGAIQVAGTAEPSQLPFFVAACDYTLIGEELFCCVRLLIRFSRRTR